MAKKHIFLTFLVLLVGWLSAAQLSAQCTSFAGNITPVDLSFCKNSAGPIQAAASTGAVLDADDIMRYVLHTGSASQLGTIISTGTANGEFFAPFPSAGTYTISAVVGSRIPGTVLLNYNDPCLSVVYAGTLTINEAPGAQVSVNGGITCGTPTVTVSASLVGSFNLNEIAYAWTGPGVVSTIGLNAEVNEPGLYTFTVTHVPSGCTDSATVIVQSSLPTLFFIPSAADPCEADPSTVMLQCSLITNIAVQSYQWSNGGSTQSIEVPNVALGAVNNYCVTVTLVNGCQVEGCYNLTHINGFAPSILTEAFCDSSYYALLAGYYPLATYSWSHDPSAIYPYALIDAPGFYEVTITLPQGCSATASIFVEDDDACATLKGRVVGDLDSSCSETTGDQNLGGIQLEIKNLSNSDVYYVITEPDGTWERGVASGNYSVTVLPPNGVWEPCIATQIESVSGFSINTLDNFYLKPIDICPRLEVDLSTPFLRRCFNSVYAVRYCNTGAAVAEDAYIEVLLDEFLSFVSSSVPGTNLGNNLYRFDLGDVAVGACGDFTIVATVSCNAVLGQAHCTEATAYPNAPCGTLAGNWSGASLQLSAECTGDSLRIHFTNVGTAPLTNGLEYVVIEDAIMLKSVPPPTLPLVAGQTYTDAVPANGATWYVSAAQEPNHPGNSAPSISVEGCTTGNTFSTGFVNVFPQDDADYWKDIDCTENVGSYDPNDKQGFPVGYGDGHRIERGVDIEYLIRFQNTGTDTAFTVVIRDTLSPWLDPKTLIPGASSHPYRMEFYGVGNNVKFVFDNIQLPDSSKTQSGSQGFVSYRISQADQVPYGTKIENSAAIYFDFNEPVITNTVFHTVDQHFVLVSNWEAALEQATISISPNPMTNTATLTFKGLPTDTPLRVEVLDALGRVQMVNNTVNGSWTLRRGELPAGNYWIRATADGQLVGTAQLMVK